jgi:hypothetical protein
MMEESSVGKNEVKLSVLKLGGLPRVRIEFTESTKRYCQQFTFSFDFMLSLILLAS